LFMSVLLRGYRCHAQQICQAHELPTRNAYVSGCNDFDAGVFTWNGV
jgi:hypothetical protein